MKFRVSLTKLMAVPHKPHLHRAPATMHGDLRIQPPHGSSQMGESPIVISYEGVLSTARP